MKNIIKKLGLSVLYVLGGIYLLFLILPFIVNPFLTKYSDSISKMTEDTCGLKISIDKLRIVTTPKLTVGFKIASLKAALPNGEEFLSMDNTQAKLSIIPLLAKKVEGDVISIENIDAILKVKPNGDLLIIDYLPDVAENEEKEQLTSLPLGLKLSNRLPNIRIDEYSLSMVDMRDNRAYTLQGGNLKVTDFVLDKRVKFSTVGTISFNGTEQFKYDIKIYNKIMPDINLNDLIFAQNADNCNNQEKKTQNQNSTCNITDILKQIKSNQLKAEAKLDIETEGTVDDVKVKGLLSFDKLSVLVDGMPLPEGHFKLNFKGKKFLSDIALYTASNELTSVSGTIYHGKNAGLDIKVKSNAGINNIFRFLNTVCSSFNIDDLKTLSAKGNLDIDFNIKSDLKSVNSSGYIRIPTAAVRYGLYNILIDNINADVDLKNMVNIKNLSFNILSQPLKIAGTISHDAIADIHLIADKLLLKGLLTAAGQINILKENDVKSGTVSVDAVIKGPLKNISPTAEVNLSNINVYNKPTKTSLNLANSKINLYTNGKNYKGNIDASTINIVNPAVKFSVPKILVQLNEKDILIDKTHLLIDNSKIYVSGKISDYTTKDIAINLKAKGALISNDLKNMLPSDIKRLIIAKGAMPILVTVRGNDKKQTINAQLLALPTDYFHVCDLKSVNGKSTLLTSDILIEGNSLVFENSGVYATNLKSLSDNSSQNISGTNLLKLTGGISDLSNLTLKNLSVSTSGAQTISVPTFKNSTATLNGNVTLNGNAMKPVLSGSINSSIITLPTIKTELKNSSANLGKTISLSIPHMKIDNSDMSVKLSINPNFTKGIIVDDMDYKASVFDSDKMISALAPLTSGSTSSAASDANLGIVIINGKGLISRFISGKIIANTLTSNFNLKNNIFYLKDLKGNAFDGKIAGDISCNVLKGNSSVKMTGTAMSAVKALAGAAGIPNALSGTLDFAADLHLNAFAPNYNSMLKSVTGNIKFEVNEGSYMNIGTIDQFVFASNIASNAILNVALKPIKNLPAIKNSSAFSKISGNLTLSNGIATLKSVKSSGPSVSYFVTGQYNVINGYTNVIILGRMGADIVKALGPLGDMSVSKLTSYLPSFGAKTLTMLSSLTSDPKTEKVSEIPALSGNNTNHKDFKVLFIGNVSSPASVKSFKWLSICDTSAIETGTIKEQVKSNINAIKQSGQNTINDAKQSVEDTKKAIQTTKEDIQNQVQKTKESINELKNLKNMFKPKTQTTETTPSNSTENTQNTTNTDNSSGQ